MSKPFKKKKQTQQIKSILNLSILLPQGSQNTGQTNVVVNRELIIKYAMFWDTKNRVERIKSLNLSNLNLEEFQDSQDFSIDELESIELLSLSKNRIMHLQPISVLESLISLNVNNNKIYSLSPLESLIKLQQLYASNNEITSMSSLSNLIQLKIINLYNNKIQSFDTTIAALSKLSKLEDLDLQQNPFYNDDLRAQFVKVGNLRKFNDKTVIKSQRELNKKDNLMNMTSSCLINPLNMSMMRATNTSFFNQSSKSKKTNKLQDLRRKLQNLEEEYSKIDDQFQQEIVKNVRLKSQFHELNQRLKKSQELKEQNQYKTQQIKLMKRKAKDLKQNLFKIQSKGHLLRQLFELQTQLSMPKKTQRKQVKQQKIWVRKFDCDDCIIIEDYSKYLEEDKQIAYLLESNSSQIEQLRRELSYLN